MGEGKMKLQPKKRLSLFLCRKNNRELSCFDISSLKIAPYTG